MEIPEILKKPELCNELCRFLTCFNPDVDWRAETMRWLERNIDDLHILERIRVLTWVDTRAGVNLSYDNEELRMFRVCSSVLKNIKFMDTRNIEVLDFDRSKCTGKMEQFHDNCLRIVGSILSMKNVKYKLQTFEKLGKNKDGTVIIDLGWMLIKRRQLREYNEMKNVIHLNLYNMKRLNDNYIVLIPVLRKAYYYITSSSDEREKK